MAPLGIPIARVWRDRTAALAWLPFTHLEAQQAAIGDLVKVYGAATRHSLTSYAYLVEAIYALNA
jgi:hypothetical protein